MDWRLVRYSFAMDGDDLIEGGYTKRMLRLAMKGYMPERVRLRKSKIGFHAPLRTWLKSGLDKVMLEISRDSVFRDNVLWDGVELGRRIEDAVEKVDTTELMKLWRFTLVSCLLTAFEKQRKKILSES